MEGAGAFHSAGTQAMMNPGRVDGYRLVATMTIKRARIIASHSIAHHLPCGLDLPGGWVQHPTGRAAKRRKSPRLAGTPL